MLVGATVRMVSPAAVISDKAADSPHELAEMADVDNAVAARVIGDSHDAQPSCLAAKNASLRACAARLASVLIANDIHSP